MERVIENFLEYGYEGFYHLDAIKGTVEETVAE